jgi:hypothetical protein
MVDYIKGKGVAFVEIVLGLLLAGFIVFFIFEKLSKKKAVEEISVPTSEKCVNYPNCKEVISKG